MQNKSYWLVIEPYAHIFIKPRKAIIYNTLNNKYIEAKNNSKVYDLLKSLSAKKNLYVIELKEEEINDKEISKFINLLREYFIGDILNKEWSDKKPIQMTPLLKIEDEITGNNINEDIKELEHITELNFFINSNNDDIKQCNKQFLFNSEFNSLSTQELDFDTIKKLLEIVKVEIINIAGINIFEFKKFNKFLNLITGFNIFPKFFVNYQNPDISTENLINLKKIKAQLNISVAAPLDMEKIQKTKKIIDEISIFHHFDFKIESEQDIKVFENAINKLNIENYTFHPYYNGNNIELFEQAVYLTKEDIFEAKPTQKDIFARQAINQLNFGKLYILPDGSAYSNLYKPKLGNLNKHSVHELVHKEMYKHKNWFKLRKNVKPCRSCVYNLLCPPISNYEYAIGKYNLCHVWEEN